MAFKRGKSFRKRQAVDTSHYLNKMQRKRVCRPILTQIRDVELETDVTGVQRHPETGHSDFNLTPDDLTHVRQPVTPLTRSDSRSIESPITQCDTGTSLRTSSTYRPVAVSPLTPDLSDTLSHTNVRPSVIRPAPTVQTASNSRLRVGSCIRTTSTTTSATETRTVTFRELGTRPLLIRDGQKYQI